MDQTIEASKQELLVAENAKDGIARDLTNTLDLQKNTQSMV